MNKNINGNNLSWGKRETTSETHLGNNYEFHCCCKKWFVVTPTIQKCFYNVESTCSTYYH